MTTLGTTLQLACIFEATARKPGNVHRYRDFADLAYSDLLVSAAAISPVLARSCEIGVGRAILDAVQATRALVPTNSNLGIILLLAPLAAAAMRDELRPRIDSVLSQLTLADSRNVFEAIRIANPGGLGSASSEDVHSEPTLPLKSVMELAQDRDLIARQYANSFRDVFETGVPSLVESMQKHGDLETAIIATHLHLIANLGDTHICRRAGLDEETAARRRACDVLALGWPQKSEARHALIAFDGWLREPGTRRNPGATADLVAASLFVALWERRIALPVRFASTFEPLP